MPDAHGEDVSSLLRNTANGQSDDRIVYLRATGYDSWWIAAVNDRYKIVYSVSDDPWLFDLEKDFEEKINQAENPEYASIRKELTSALVEQLRATDDPVLKMKAYQKWLQ